MKFSDKIFLTIRGIRTINELIPGYYLFAGIKSMLEAFLPFVNIYMSGLVITAIADHSSWQKLVVLMVLMVVLNFLTTLLINVFSRIANVKSSAFWTVMDLPLDRKIQTMDYEYVEDPKVHEKRAAIDNKRLTIGRGITRLFWWYFQTGVKSIFQLIFSVALVFSAFTAKPSQTDHEVWDWIFSPWTTVILVGVLAFSLALDMYIQAVNAKKQTKY